MFNHVSIGVRDLAAAKRFYDAALAPLGLSARYQGEGALGYGPDGVGLWVLAVDRPVPADTGSGLHFCFDAPDPAAVRAFHAAALAHGGEDNGAPGPRADYGDGYYAAYVIDPDGYRMEAYCHAPGG